VLVLVSTMISPNKTSETLSIGSSRPRIGLYMAGFVPDGSTCRPKEG
jgi:hypothetical protein